MTTGEGTLLGRIITWLIVGIIAIVALKLALGLVGVALGVAWGLAMLLLFKVLPVVVLLWLLYKGFQLLTRPTA